MKTVVAFVSILMMFIFTIPANAGGKEELKKYFNNTANKVKATENVSEKREILNESFENMYKVLDEARNSGLISKEDQSGIDNFKAALKEKQDELEGRNGFERVSDSQLNNFSLYVVQDMEQAAAITISLLALVIIAILLVIFVF
ncbi:MAG: hypothetical protein R6W68_07930 [Ignavibacteriaceae bacterium]